MSLLQRKLKLGYSRSARIIYKLEELGVVGPYMGANPHSVLVTRKMWQQIKLMDQNDIDTNV